MLSLMIASSLALDCICYDNMCAASHIDILICFKHQLKNVECKSTNKSTGTRVRDYLQTLVKRQTTFAVVILETALRIGLGSSCAFDDIIFSWEEL